MREEIALSKRFSIICCCSPARFALTGPLLAVCKCKISKIYLKSKKYPARKITRRINPTLNAESKGKCNISENV